MLSQAYERAPGGYVAFLDETFQLDDSDKNRREFYMLSAVVVHRDDLAGLRSGLRKVVGGTFWHTSESLKTPEGRERAREVAEFLGDPEGNEVGIVAIKTVHLMILEQRRMQRNRSYDTSIVNDLRKGDVLCRRCRMIQVSPSAEHLLWLPDLVSSAVRHHHLGQKGDVDLYAPLARILYVSNCP